MKTELLNKSIDELVEIFFAEDVNKSLDIKADAKTTADAAVNQAPKLQDDASRGAGRPKQISDVPASDEDGKRDGTYDASIASAQSASDQPEISQVKQGPTMKKSVEISEEEFAEFQAMKKSQEAAKVEELKKAEAQKTEDLVKSVVSQVSAKYEATVNDLKKSLNESNALIKSMAAQPQRAKSVTGIESLEKSQEGQPPRAEAFTKSEILDAATELFQKGQLRDDHVIELENSGFIYDKSARTTLENYLKNKK